jgi:glycosyltransferase involved in cell wall biosynthesis
MFINRKTQKLVDRYSCISPYVCCCLVKEGVALRRIEVIYLGADSSGFQINKSGESAWIVAYVGRHAHEKGTDIFYSIVEAYLEKWKGDRVEFHLFGEGKFSRGKIASLQNKYPNSFIVHGFVEDLSQYHIDCIILPSRDEGFSFVLLEAFFRGIPVIASNQGALPELITDGETGIICNNDDISTYLSAIKKLKENTAFRESVAKNAHQVAEQKFTSQVMQQKYIELIDRLIYCKEGIK